jgi:hypothetical protein
MNINKENIYSQGTVYTSSFLNKPLHEHLAPTPIIILTTLFWSKNTLFALFEYPQKMIVYLIKEWKYEKDRLISLHP